MQGNIVDHRLSYGFGTKLWSEGDGEVVRLTRVSCELNDVHGTFEEGSRQAPRPPPQTWLRTRTVLQIGSSSLHKSSYLQAEMQSHVISQLSWTKGTRNEGHQSRMKRVIRTRYAIQSMTSKSLVSSYQMRSLGDRSKVFHHGLFFKKLILNAF